ncbi:MAG: zinc dependent phospholipase C family protein [Erysipelotrichia bacterium]|nr:zinc dependent phospholipase C family protein [Erysipelotrichia bacterium]
MPSATTHCLCGELALNSSNSSLNKIINQNRIAYYSGCQGPDFLMYYHILPWQNQKNAQEIRKLSTELHETKINAFFEKMLAVAVEKKDEALIAYVSGFLCHHALDSIAHPYIYYFTDSIDKNTGYSHQIFESQLDLGILQNYKLTVKQYRTDKHIRKIKRGREAIGQTLKEAINTVYDADVSAKEMLDGLDDMVRVVHLLTDVNGRRYRLIEFIEKLFNKPQMGTSMIVPQKYDDKLDAMNYRRDNWCYPTDADKKSNCGFEQLFQEAINKTEREFIVLENVLHGKQTINDLLKLIGGCSYATGLSNGEKMTYFWKDRVEK